MAKLTRRDFLKTGTLATLGTAAAMAVPAASAMAEETKADTEKKFSGIDGQAGVIDRTALPVRDWNDPELKLRVRWSGVNFYEFVLPNGKTIVMDPYFDDPNDTHNEHKYTPTDLPGGEWVNGADYVVLTHGHGDHTGELNSVLKKYPAAQVIIPENTLPSVLIREKVNYTKHYFTEAGAHDQFEFEGATMETCRSNHNLSAGPEAEDEADYSKYYDENGKLDFFKFYGMIYEREIMNMKLVTDEGFTILIWNSEMQPDGTGFETRKYFYRDVNPDLFMYQVAGASLGYDRRNPTCDHMGNWIASVKAKAALPEHQQHFAYEELDAMAEKFAAICNDRNVGTSFLTPETGVWYGYTKDADGNVQTCLVKKD